MQAMTNAASFPTQGETCQRQKSSPGVLTKSSMMLKGQLLRACLALYTAGDDADAAEPPVSLIVIVIAIESWLQSSSLSCIATISAVPLKQ
jgi:hypothetical protein